MYQWLLPPLQSIIHNWLLTPFLTVHLPLIPPSPLLAPRSSSLFKTGSSFPCSFTSGPPLPYHWHLPPTLFTTGSFLLPPVNSSSTTGSSLPSFICHWFLSWSHESLTTWSTLPFSFSFVTSLSSFLKVHIISSFSFPLSSPHFHIHFQLDKLSSMLFISLPFKIIYHQFLIPLPSLNCW